MAFSLKSPYSTSILFSRSPQGKLAIRVDLIFEEYISIDIYKKIFIKTKDESGKRKASTFQPKDFRIVEDDDDQICQPPTEETAQRDIDSIVGVPHKEEAVACCDEVHPLAKSIGAVSVEAFRCEAYWLQHRP